MTILEKVRALVPIQFRYTHQLDPSQALRAGFSAQQVQELFPDAVVQVNGILAINVDILGSYIKEAQRQQNIAKAQQG